jgi:hypothetical protein
MDSGIRLFDQDLSKPLPEFLMAAHDLRKQGCGPGQQVQVPGRPISDVFNPDLKIGI